MKVIKKQIESQSEIEVEVRYAKMDSTVHGLIKRIEHFGRSIYGTDNGRQYKIQVGDIYYIESVDKKTFIYTKEAVFRSELRLYQLFEILKETDFVQVSKFCIVNMDVMESIRTLPGSRMESTLINGEKINVSRTYLSEIKAAFIAKEDD